jgi:ATP-dependent protease Clp ATPase subunit
MIIFPQQERVVRQMSHVIGTFAESEGQIRPHFHLTGPSGSGKSFLINLIAQERRLPFLEVNAAGLTAEGLSGNSLSKALRKLREHWNEPNIIFVDEFDKLFQRNGETTEGFRSMVQDEFLTALEGKYTSIFTDYGKYEPVRIDNSLFIFAGAYSNQKIETMAALKEVGMRREFVGRVPLVFSTEEVPVSELRKVIPKLDLYQKYKALYPNTHDATASKMIASVLEKQNRELGIGIRLLNSAVHQHFMRDI